MINNWSDNKSRRSMIMIDFIRWVATSRAHVIKTEIREEGKT